MSNWLIVGDYTQALLSNCERLPNPVSHIMDIEECFSPSLFHDLCTSHYGFGHGKVLAILLFADNDRVSLSEFSLNAPNAWRHNVRTFRDVWHCTHIDYCFGDRDFQPIKGFEAWIELPSAPNE